MPELAVAYSVGFLICVLMTGLFLLLIRRRRASAPYVAVRANLRTLGLYWSENLDRLTPWSGDFEEADQKATEKTVLLTGTLLCFLSWAGLIFLLVLMISYRFLARSRLERQLLDSPLAASQTLSVEEARRLIAEIAPDLQATTS